jgi:hypothetical protein
MSIVFNALALLIAGAALILSWRTDRRQKQAQDREKKSAALQIRPLIQARPVAFFIHEGFGQTTLEVTNPSGYEAYELSLDIKYEENDWIAEWLKANQQPPVGVLKLGPGAGIMSIFNGSLPYSEDEICTKRKTFNVLVRMKWKNEMKRNFETIGKYQLLCTTVGDNRSFAFLLQEQTSYE